MVKEKQIIGVFHLLRTIVLEKDTFGKPNINFEVKNQI